MNSPRTASGYFIIPLGPWTHRTHHLDFVPFCSHMQTVAIQGHGLYWHLFSSDSSQCYRATKTFLFHHATVNLHSPNHLACIENSHPQSLVLLGSSPLMMFNITPDLAWPLCSAHFPNNGLSVAAAFASGLALAICDGSYMPTHFPGLAAAAWIIQPGTTRDDYHIPCHGVTQVQGSLKIINSYWAELQGLYTSS